MKKAKTVLIELLFTAIIFAIIYIICSFTLLKWFNVLNTGFFKFIICLFIFFFADLIYRLIKIIIKSVSSN